MNLSDCLYESKLVKECLLEGEVSKTKNPRRGGGFFYFSSDMSIVESM